jgi:hypothetical protein
MDTQCNTIVKWWIQACFAQLAETSYREVRGAAYAKVIDHCNAPCYVISLKLLPTKTPADVTVPGH